MAGNANESGERSGVSPSGRMLLNALGVIVLALASWNIYATSQLEAKHAASEERLNAHERSIAECKETQKNSESKLEAWMNKLGDKIDRLSERIK